MNELSDIVAEKSVISGIFNYGESVYWDVCDIIQEARTFTNSHNQIIWDLYKKCFEEQKIKSIDIASLYSTGINNTWLQKDSFKKYLDSIIQFHILPENIRQKAQKIRRLYVIRDARDKIADVDSRLMGFTGDESITEIFAAIEQPVWSLSHDAGENEPVHIGSKLLEYIEDKISNPNKTPGISTLSPSYDWAIGGGLRPGSLNVIAGRAKSWKSGWAITHLLHFAQLGIKCIICDTELLLEEQMPRLLGAATGITVNDIETGQFSIKADDKATILDAEQKLKDLPFYHIDFSNVPDIEQQQQIISRFLRKNVGVNFDGSANPCVVVFDYIKIMDKKEITQNIAEYQALGYLTSSLKNLAQRYKIPILAFAQMNRSGQTEQTSINLAGSDRILHFANNVSILANKTQEEIESDPEGGNFKLIVDRCRNGPGLKDSHINLNVNLSTFQMKEIGISNLTEQKEVIDF